MLEIGNAKAMVRAHLGRKMMTKGANGKGGSSNPERLPSWLKVKIPTDEGDVRQVAKVLKRGSLHTVCTSARCPNIGDCWRCGTATFMILGTQCTRNCRFCAVSTHRTPPPPDPLEPSHIADAVSELGLKYVVITSVTRDDLPDGGAGHYAATVHAVKGASPSAMVELLIPDLAMEEEALKVVLSSGADVVGHNLETVRRLTPLVRDQRASYERSLAVLEWFAKAGVVTKTSLLLGLSESVSEVEEALRDARNVGVRHVAMGQYLRPSSKHYPVARYWTPEEFTHFGDVARQMGFDSVASAPLVRSSYRAEEFVGKISRNPR